MDQGCVLGKVVEDNEGHLDSLGVHLPGNGVVFSHVAGIKAVGLSVVLIIDAAAVGNSAKEQVVGNLPDPKVC